MAIQFSNLASTALASGVSSSATSVSVTSASSFPTLGSGDYFYATIGAGSGSEIVKVTGISGTTFTVSRGEDGTTAVSHSAGVDVALRVTAGTLEDLRDGGQVYTAGSGLGLSGNEFTNTAPDQTVSISGSGSTTVTGTYPSFTVSSTSYSHPSAHPISFITGLQTALDGKVDDSQVLTNVPSGALFTDTNTVYTHPSAHGISFITGLQAALDGKVDDSQVLTNVPSGALFTDTVYTLPFTDNSANWNTAYGWGDHASGGYLTSHQSLSGYATETYVGNQITALVDSSPATMDTLNELAAALGDDPNFATTVSTSIGTKWTQDNTKISQWNTAYTYSQVGHVELDGTSIISGSSASNGTRTAMVWMRGKVGDSVNQINVQGANIEFGQGGTLDTTPAFKFSHQGVLTATGRLNASGGNSDQWNTAYGWGNHASAGYLTSYTDTNTTYSIQDGELSQNNFTDADHTKLNGIATGANNYTLPFTNNSANWNTAYGWGNHASAGYLTSYTDTNTTYSAGTGISLSGTTFSLTDTNAKLNLSGGTMTGELQLNARLDIGSGTQNDAEIRIYKADNNVSDHIQFYNGTTRMGEIGCHDTTWLRINQSTAKNIYTPRYIRADGGFFVDSTAKGINGSGNFIGGTITGASDANVSNWNTAYGWGNHASAGYLTSYTDTNTTYSAGTGISLSGTTFSLTDTNAKLNLSGGTLTGALEIAGNGDLLNLRAPVNGNTVRMTFSSNVPDTQVGHIQYTHQNTASYGSGEAFYIGGTESTTTILADGKLMFKEGIYLKPATGTGAGTRKDSNWDTAYGWGDHASAGYTSNVGDITGVTVGTGLDGGGTSGTVNITLDLSEFTDMTAAVVGTQDELILLDNGAERRKLISEITLSDFNNDSGWTSNVGDITGVTAGTGLTGGGTSGTPTLNVIGGTGITANANDIAVDSTVLTTSSSTQVKAGVLNTRNNAVDDETLFAITDSDTTESIKAKFYTTSNAFSKVDDATAPASGVFKVQGSVSPVWGEYIPMDDETEIMFECWIKHVSGSDTSGNFYAGGQFYNGSKTSYGNTQRYWGANGDTHDSNTPNPPRWRHIKGVMHGGAIRSQSTTPDAQYVRLLTLFNYNASGNASHFCGFRFYRSKKTISSLWLKTHNTTSYNQDSAWQNLEASTSVNIIDNAGNITSPATITASGGNSANWNTAYGWGNHASAGYTSNVGDITGVTAGTGLTGGGSSGTPTLNVIGGSGITANANDIVVDSTVIRTTGSQSMSGTKTFTGSITTPVLTMTGVQNRTKLSVWSGSTYGIGMHNAHSFGGLNDYAMTFQMNNDSDRGFWWGDDAHTNAQGAMSLTTNGKLSVASGIRVGYGETDTTSPAAGLAVSGTTTLSGQLDMNNNDIVGVDQIFHEGDSNTYMQFHAADQWRVVTGGAERLEVNNTQVTVAGNMVVSGTLSVRTAIDLADNDILRFGSSDDVEFFCNGSHMYMDLNAGIGNFYIRDTTTTRFTFDDAGHFTATGNITAYSDIRLKEDIKPIEDAVSKVQQLTGNTYTRNDLKDPDRRYGGVIAQEVEVVLPEAVSESEDGTKTVDYNAMIALLVESVKELKSEVDDLKAQLEAK